MWIWCSKCGQSFSYAVGLVGIDRCNFKHQAVPTHTFILAQEWLDFVAYTPNALHVDHVYMYII